jgi:Phosphodiester glycosidase
MRNRLTALCLILGVGSAIADVAPTSASTTAPTSAPALPFVVERFDRPGPVRGVLARVDLSDPRVRLVVERATPTDPDGDGPLVTTLDTVSAIAERYDMEIALNASFFGVAGSQERAGRKVSYFVGNPGRPVGWLVVDGKTWAKPEKPAFENVLLVDSQGRASIEKNVQTLLQGVKYAVSGNVRVLDAGVVTDHRDDARHPRSIVGLDADRKTLWLVAVDGRREGWSRGMTYAESGQLMKELGANDALNLDGGGSTQLVAEEPAIGTYPLLNRASDTSKAINADSVPRPVTDVVGVQVAD